jgi:hypothetical protein
MKTHIDELESIALNVASAARCAFVHTNWRRSYLDKLWQRPAVFGRTVAPILVNSVPHCMTQLWSAATRLAPC